MLVQRKVDSDPKLLAAAVGALEPGERLTWADLAEPHSYRRQVRAHDRWFRVVRMVFCACVGLLLYYVGTHLHLGPRDAAGWSNPMLVVFLVQCIPLVFMAQCGITVLLDIVQPMAWAARAASVLYVVTNRRVLLLARTNHQFGWSIGGRVLPDDQWTTCGNRRLAEREGISIRTVAPIINATANHTASVSPVVLDHHDCQGEHGHWHRSATSIPGVINAVGMCQRIKEMRTYRQAPCPRLPFDRNVQPACPCVVTESEARAGRAGASVDRAQVSPQH